MTLHYPVYVQPTSGDPSWPLGIPFSAQELRRNIQALMSLVAGLGSSQSGVTPLDGQFDVTQRGAGANFSVDVASGHAYVLGTDVTAQGVYGSWNDGTINVATPSAPTSGTEVHRLVLQIEDKYENGTWTGYTANLTLLADTGSGTPAAPASSITLALISISAGQASVLNANITDERVLLGDDSWHYVGTTGAPAFGSGWSNYGSGGVNLCYRHEGNGNVRMLGLIKPAAGAGTTIFTLPAGYRPVTTQTIVGVQSPSTTVGEWNIEPSGVVEGAGFGGFTTGDSYVVNGSFNLTA